MGVGVGVELGSGLGFRRLLVHDEQAHSRLSGKQRHGALVRPEAVPRASVAPADACEGAQLFEGRGRMVAS